MASRRDILPLVMAIAGLIVLHACPVSELVRQAFGIIQYLHDSPVFINNA